jgi:hypothetical protein
MSETGNLTLASTNADQFKASGEMAHLRRWLAEVRDDMTTSACRQVGHYAREFIRLFGAETPHLVEGPTEHLEARLDAVDLPRHGYASEKHRHLLRAGKALHAAVHDLDADTTRNLMDRRTPQRRPSSGGMRAGHAPLPSGDLLDALPTDLPGSAAATKTAETAPDDDVPSDVRPVVEAVAYLVTARMTLDDALDIRIATKAVLATLDPATRVHVALRLPGAARLPVVIRQATPALDLAHLAEEVIVSLMEQRYADVRSV